VGHDRLDREPGLLPGSKQANAAEIRAPVGCGALPALKDAQVDQPLNVAGVYISLLRKLLNGEGMHGVLTLVGRGMRPGTPLSVIHGVSLGQPHHNLPPGPALFEVGDRLRIHYFPARRRIARLIDVRGTLSRSIPSNLAISGSGGGTVLGGTNSVV
jgi:hypothetical protein